MSEYHNPVLAKESIEAMSIKSDGIYIDATFGGGGHSRLILKELGENGHLHGFDQDEDSLRNIPDDKRFTLNHHNFRFMKRFMRYHGIEQVDGILADLGVSSHQFNEAERGFSFRFDADLDMRMNQRQEKNAADILNEYRPASLQEIFSRYGEIRNSKTLAEAIAEAREFKKIKTIADFLEVLGPIVRGKRNQYLAQVFQALRIEVNDEVGVLESFLLQCKDILAPGGKLVVISYHSLEDRLVKNLLKTGNLEGEVIKDDFGKIDRPFKVLTKKPILPTAEELQENSRARSAKMRVGMKV